jgi:sugar phosphate isomerase/epimerase
MRGVCDMHVHTNPDLRLRAYNDFELAEAGIRVGARAIVIKSHLGFTVNRAAMANEFVRRMYGDDTGFTMYGGVVMNKVIGGVNPEAVEKGLKLGAKVIWLPTQSAKQHLLKMGKDPADGIELVRDGKVVPELKDVFSLIRDYDVTLGTAHVSPEEAFVVVEAARDAGVKKIVVTHPEWWIVGMSVEDQIRMVRDYDVILERCYAQNMGGGTYKSNLPDNLDIIREVGYKNVMVDTDGGQTENPHWELALEEYMQYLSDHGITDDELYYMTRTIPYRLLGIEN